MPKKDIRGAMARPCQHRRVIRVSGNGAIEQRCKEQKMEIDRQLNQKRQLKTAKM